LTEKQKYDIINLRNTKGGGFMSYSTDTIELRKLMIEKGYNTTISFSKACKINRKTMGLILNGSIQPTSESMYKMVECLAISPEQAGNIFFSKSLRNT